MLLRTVLEETNENVFEDQLCSLVDRLGSTATLEFQKYFIQNWVDVKRHWGYCYRVGDGINTNMFVEAFHRTFKYNYLKGKYNKRVDTVLVNLLKFSRDMSFSRLIKLTKGALTQRMKTIHDRHLSSKKLCYAAIKETDQENVYSIQSEDGKRNYSVTKLSDNCEVAGCKLRCIECSVCTHCFHCNCPDFLINNTSCKHVHLLKQYLLANNKLELVSTESMDYSDDYTQKEIDSTLANLTNQVEEPTSFERIKSKTSSLLLNLMQRVENCSNLDIEALRHVEKQVTSTLNTFDAMSKYQSVKELKPTSSVPANKNITRQLKFYSTKKKRKRNSNVRYAKPTSEEKVSFFMKLENEKDLIDPCDDSLNPATVINDHGGGFPAPTNCMYYH